MGEPGNIIITKSDQVAIERGYYFDREKADKALAWIDATFGAKPYAWQRDALYRYFGWRNARGGYRFNEIRIWIPKKNGKSYLISLLIAYKLFELKYARIYSAACTAKQAGVIMDGVKQLLEKSPKLRKHLTPRTGRIKAFNSVFRREVFNGFTNSTYHALAKGTGSNDGIIPDVLAIDEIHQMDNEQIDIIDNSTANMPDTLKIIISTSGSGDKTHRSWDKYQYTKAVLKGEKIDVQLLPIIYECQKEDMSVDELYSIDTYLACNPVAVEREEVRREVEAKLPQATLARNDNNYKRYRLNIWVDADEDEYIPAPVYEACEVQPISDDELKGADLYVGIDMGGTWDFTAFAFLFALPDGRSYERHHTFAVADRIKEMSDRDDQNYQRYIDTGELTVIPGDVPMDPWLTEWLTNELAKYNVKQVAGDPYFARYLVETLTVNGFEVVNVQQSNNRALTPAIEDYQARVRQKRIVHPRNALYLWQLSKARKITASKDACKIVKARSNERGKGGSGHIDNVDACLNALAAMRIKEIEAASCGSGGAITL